MLKFIYMKNQQGSMSFLTVIFLAIVLSIITLSFVRISTTEQRQAVDDDLTTRAFYAAESGVEDAKRAISDYVNGTLSLAQLNPDVCDPAGVVSDGELNATLETEYTCQFINLNPDDYQDELDPWESVTIPLSGLGAFDDITISWHIPGDDGTIVSRGTSNLPDYVVWNNSNYAAMLRAAVIDTPAGSFDRNQMASRSIFINPHTSGGGTFDVNASDGNIVNAQCADVDLNDPADSGEYLNYACTVELSGFSGLNANKYLHLQALYRGAHIQISLENTQFDDVQAVIDVTGRSGDVFRRVEARVSLVEDNFNFPDVAVWSNEEICKNFTVTDDPADFDPGNCSWSSP